MAEYLDKEAFKKSVEERYCKPCKAEKKDHNGCWCRACWVDDMLDEVECFQPADVAPVVRCKECEHAERYERTDGTVGYYCGQTQNTFTYGERWDRVFKPVKEPDGFCSRGERKDGGDADR